jgi:D-galactonate transporter
MDHDAAGAPSRCLNEVDAVYSKIAKRIVPFLALLGLMAWLDRYNLGFAKLRMVKDLGFSEAVYGFGAGILYLGYLLFEVPSNLLLEKIGARKTFARITILWGITSIAMMFVKTATWFYILRFLLGSFEAGLYPGAILYLTYWFPARRRARVVALFFLAAPLSIILGSPVSGWIIHSMGGQAGLANWQWLFLLEGIPSVLIGLLALVILVDKPQDARWLTEREKQLVLADLAADNCQSGPREHDFGRALRVARVWLLGAMYFCLISANQTIPFWLPSIVQGLRVKNALTIGTLIAVPYIAAMIGMVLVGRHSDRTLERRYHAALPCLACALGLIGIGVFAKSPALAFIAIIATAAGTLTASVVFWQVPPMLLAGTAAAGGIALTNSLGSFSGWIGPTVVGWLEDLTGKTTTGLYVVGGLEILGTILILRFVPPRPAARSAAGG